MKTKLLMTVAMAALIAPGMAQAASTMKSTQAQPTASESQVSTPQFIKSAAIANMFEIETSKLAQEKSKNQDVLQFAEAMIGDHQQVGDEFKVLLKQQSMSDQAPAKLDAEHTKKLEQLQAAAGTDFDKSYKQMQIKAHEQAVNLFQSYGQNGDNAELKSWAASKVATLRQHLQQAEAIALPQTTGGL